MNELQKLYNELVIAEENYAECRVNAQQKSEELNSLKLEMSGLKSRLVGVDSLLDNAKRGVGISLSMEELTALRKDSSDTNSRLEELNDFIQMTQNKISSMNRSRTLASSHVRSLKDKATNIISDHAASKAVAIASVQLKELTHTAMSLHGLSFQSTSPAELPALYQQIGKRICQQLFETKNEVIILPTITESMSERDLLLDNLA